MTFPAVQGTNTSIEATAVTAHDVSLPASVSAGELLAAILGAVDSFGGISAETGWTEEVDNANVVVESKIAAGGDSNPQFDSTFSVPSAHNSYRISGAHGDVDVATAAGTDPPNLAPAWGADDTLWIAGVVAADSGGTVDVTAAPTNYTNLLKSSVVTSGGTTFLLATARRELNAASENPGTFTVSAVLETTPIAFTIAIRPAAVAAANKVDSYRRRRTG